MITLGSILQRVVIEYGPSGSGKSVLQKALQDRADLNRGNMLYEASGDLFRKVKTKINKFRAEGIEGELSTEERAAAAFIDKMDKGEQLPSLQPIAPELVNTVENLMLSVCRDEDVQLVLDGVLRNGKGEYSSQMTQLSEVFIRAGRKLIQDHPGLVQKLMADRKIDVEMVRQFANHKDQPYLNVEDVDYVATMAEGIRKSASHIVIDVPEADQEMFMRARSAKALGGGYRRIGCGWSIGI